MFSLPMLGGQKRGELPLTQTWIVRERAGTGGPFAVTPLGPGATAVGGNTLGMMLVRAKESAWNREKTK
jgi:hypothetical protein